MNIDIHKRVSHSVQSINGVRYTYNYLIVSMLVMNLGILKLVSHGVEVINELTCDK